MQRALNLATSPQSSYSPVLFSRLLIVRQFSLSAVLRKKPRRPEPTGEVIAHFPQKRETVRMHESGKMYATRWKRYIDDLSKSAVPSRIGGRDFGSRVRDRKRLDVRKEAGKGDR